MEKGWCTADTDSSMDNSTDSKLSLTSFERRPFVIAKHVSCFSLTKGLRSKR